MSKAYFQHVGAQLRMTLDLQAKENDDGYQYLQLLVNETVKRQPQELQRRRPRQHQPLALHGRLRDQVRQYGYDALGVNETAFLLDVAPGAVTNGVTPLKVAELGLAARTCSWRAASTKI